MLALKQRLLHLPGFRPVWAQYRCAQLQRQYDERCDHYARLAAERKLVYREADVEAAVRRRLAERGYSPARRKMGEVHTFAFVPLRSWHQHLLPDLKELGPLTLFDPDQLGFDDAEFLARTKRGLARRVELNGLVLPALKKAHAERPVDWVFVYASGLEISAHTVRAITEELGIPTVNMCLDDKQSWSGPWMGDHRAGQIDIASAFDINWTSASVACEWYLVENGRPIYMPEGFDNSCFHPMDIQQDIPVSFIGGAYGFRPLTINHLERHDIAVTCFGNGWDGGALRDGDQASVINRSILNLGMGGIGYCEALTNVKGRDFEVPGTGGGMYLTSFNPDLARHFEIGREIACYRSRQEILELIRHYLSRPDEARKMAALARERSLREHRWLHRYQKLCRALGILP